MKVLRELKDLGELKELKEVRPQSVFAPKRGVFGEQKMTTHQFFNSTSNPYRRVWIWIAIIKDDIVKVLDIVHGQKHSRINVSKFLLSF